MLIIWSNSADNVGMETLLETALTVLRDERVIGTAIAVLLMINFGAFVANYVKKMPKPRTKVAKKSKEPPKPAPAAEGEGGEGNKAEAAPSK